MSDSDSPVDSSDEDEVDLRKMGRSGFRYSTVDGSDEEQRLRLSAAARRDQALYGVFLDDSDQEERDYQKRYQGRQRQHSNSSHQHKPAPMFVQGTRMEPKEEDSKPAAAAVTTSEASMEQQQQESSKKEPTAEELELQKSQEAANQHFLSLLERGAGKNKKRPRLSPESQPAAAGLGSAAAAGLGFAAASTRNESEQQDDDIDEALPRMGLGMPRQFGQASAPKPKKQPKKPDPSLGTWEKHTKGIGMKLLSKMGYKGSGGLGASRTKKDEAKKPVVGISRPVEVKVRPANLGLGFGRFQEATQLKVNRQLEAQVRGEDIEEEEAKKKKQQDALFASSALVDSRPSALPSVNDLMQQEAWKRGAPKKRKRTVVPYTELLQQKQPSSDVVIDMRGPTKETTTTEEPPLAEEVLHNVSLLLNTYENQIYAASSFTKSTQQKLASLESDVASLSQRQTDLTTRVTKLDRVDQLLQDIDDLTKDQEAPDILKVQSIIREIGLTFTAEERKQLQFSQLLVPSLLGSAIHSRVEQWDPLSDDVQESKELVRSIFEAASLSGSVDGDESNDSSSKQIRRSMYTQHLLPRIQSVLESSRWNPVENVEGPLRLYELLDEMARGFAAQETKGRDEEQRVDIMMEDSVLLPSDNDSPEDERQSLADLIKETIVDDLVYPKLSQKLSHWEPRLYAGDSGRPVAVENRLDLWILPWVPYINRRSLLPNLVSDCKRKVKATLYLLQKSVSDDSAFFLVAVDVLRPWRGVLKKETLQKLVSSSVTPRLARHFSKLKISRSSNDQDWTAVDRAFELNRLDLLPDLEFLSVIEGDLLARWATELHEWLSEETKDIAATTDVYIEWKYRLLQSTDEAARSTASCQLLRSDLNVCLYFHSVVRMLQAAAKSNRDALDDLLPRSTNFRVVLARRTAERKQMAMDDLVRMETDDRDTREARVRLNRNGQTPTFRDVVAEFARQRDILFQPRLGSNTSKDGKQIFLFGSVPVYLDSNVVFSQQDNEWRPTSLDALATMAR